MDLQLSAEDQAFRDEVRQFLEANLSAEIRAGAAASTSIRTDFGTEKLWWQALAKRGWSAPAWPREFGGPGWSPVQRYLFEYESGQAGAPSLNTMGTRMVGPVLMKYGRLEQREQYLPAILSGDDYWCQGYSEPGSGSDLASLQTKAVADGDDYVINGSKIWTTGAHLANRIFCLVRTSSEGKPQQGISFIVFDMDTPGIKVEPIVTIAGDHELNQTFFDDVRVPKANRVGEENQGWTVAKYLLEFERGGVPYTPQIHANLAKIKRIAKLERSSDGGRMADDPAFAKRLSALEVQTQAAEVTEKRVMSALSQGQNPGPASSMIKLRGSETNQQIQQLMAEAIAYYVAPYQPELRSPGSNETAIMPDYAVTVSGKYLNGRAATIYAGSSEVQRGIIAKRVLGL